MKSINNGIIYLVKLIKNKIEKMTLKDYIMLLIIAVVATSILVLLSIDSDKSKYENNVNTTITTDSERQRELEIETKVKEAEAEQKAKEDAFKQDQFRQCVTNSYIADNTPANEARLKEDCERIVGITE